MFTHLPPISYFHYSHPFLLLPTYSFAILTRHYCISSLTCINRLPSFFQPYSLSSLPLPSLLTSVSSLTILTYLSPSLTIQRSYSPPSLLLPSSTAPVPSLTILFHLIPISYHPYLPQSLFLPSLFPFVSSITAFTNLRLFSCYPFSVISVIPSTMWKTGNQRVVVRVFMYCSSHYDS
jgi:hypothetical protein